MMFSFALVECLSQIGRGKPLRVDADQSSPAIGAAMKAEGTPPDRAARDRVLEGRTRTIAIKGPPAAP
jgi:hypothetical protein